MSRLAKLLIELSNELLSSSEQERLCAAPSASAFSEDAATINLPRPANFSAPDGSSVKLSPGAYRVDVLAEGHFVLTSLSERHHWVVTASRAWHELRLTSPLALSVPTDGDAENIVVLFPGGGALHAGGVRARTAVGATDQSPLPTPLLVEALLRWTPVHTGLLPFDKQSLLFPLPYLVGWGTIEPGPSPTHFGPTVTPPNWVNATVVSCDRAPLGTAAPYGPPGWEAPPCPFTPGQYVIRGSYAWYVTSVTPVTVTSSLSVAGRVVQLIVTSMVHNVGNTPMFYAMWKDVYQVVPTVNGPVVFANVIVATGRAGSNASPLTWAPDAQAAFTTAQGTGAPVEFELRVDGFTFATRMCKFNARSYPQTPAEPILYCQ
jgi:hypothetical protein